MERALKKVNTVATILPLNVFEQGLIRNVYNA